MNKPSPEPSRKKKPFQKPPQDSTRLLGKIDSWSRRKKLARVTLQATGIQITIPKKQFPKHMIQNKSAPPGTHLILHVDPDTSEILFIEKYSAIKHLGIKLRRPRKPKNWSTS